MAECARNPDVEKRINEHLEAIDKALAAKGVPLIERRSVTGDVEAQVRDMLAADTGGNPTSADVEAILRKLDAPESYAEDAEAAPAEKAPSPPQAKPECPVCSAFRKRFRKGAIVGGIVGLVLLVPCLLNQPIALAPIVLVGGVAVLVGMRAAGRKKKTEC